MGVVILALLIILIIAGGVTAVFWQYRRVLREAKNYERGLKMVPLLIHLPPTSEDPDGGSRDQRDMTEEEISQAQVMYNIISSTATKGFKSKIYGQRHISFEIMAEGGLVKYYVVVPTVLVDTIRQAVASTYPSARLEEVKETNIFNQAGQMSGTIGGEFSLKKSFIYPIATYEESKRDASRALLNAMAAAKKDDGIGVQILVRPAKEGWSKKADSHIEGMRKDDSKKKGPLGVSSALPGELLEALWKPPEATADDKSKPENKQLTSLEQAEVEAIEGKARYPAYEVLIRIVVSSSTAGRSQTLLNNVVAAFALFDSARHNGFKFAMTRNVSDMVTAYILRFFPQEIDNNILNSVEMATLFHLPSSSSISSSQVKRQMSKQVDGPTDIMEEGILIGYNEFRGTKKPIRIAPKDRRRHVYIIGQTGVGKSVLQENMAYQDMMDGRGFAFIDPHGDLVESLLSKVPKERVEDIIYFDPADLSNPIGMNMFEFDTPDQKDFLVQEAINMLYSLYDPGRTGIVGPRLEHIFRNCALLLMSDPEGGTFIDVPKCLIDPEFVKSKLKYVTDPQVIDFWTKEFPASQRSNEAGEVISWVVSKFGPFISNDAMRNIIGQTKSGFDLKSIMDNRKILLVNLSKGKMGELNSKLLGIIFVMKFQAAAMARASIEEDQRVDFSLYVDEFQNFATDSFESIMSEARKYRLSLIMGNQFMTQLTDKIREAIIGNVGTIISGRIGVTDAELMVKKFQPVFDVDDLTKLPNFQSIASVMINNVPSAPFSMNWVAPMGVSNRDLKDAMIKLSATKYGRPRAVVEQEIFERLGAKKQVKPAGPAIAPTAAQKPGGSGGGGSFLDEWLSKRQQLGGAPAPDRGVKPKQVIGTGTVPSPYNKPNNTQAGYAAPLSTPQSSAVVNQPQSMVDEARDFYRRDQPAPAPVAAPMNSDINQPSVPQPSVVNSMPIADYTAAPQQEGVSIPTEYQQIQQAPSVVPAPIAQIQQPKDHLNLRGGSDDDEITISLR